MELTTSELYTNSRCMIYEVVKELPAFPRWVKQDMPLYKPHTRLSASEEQTIISKTSL